MMFESKHESLNMYNKKLFGISKILYIINGMIKYNTFN